MTKKCPNCGKNIDNNANFCINCGSKQTKEAEIKEEKTTTVESTNSVPVSGLSITGFVLSLVSLICCGLTSPLGLKESKDIVDNKGAVKENIPSSEAEDIKAKLEEAGATVEVK